MRKQIRGLFGDSWDDAFQYEDAEGRVIGCYIDRHYIEKHEAAYEEELENRVKYFLEKEG